MIGARSKRAFDQERPPARWCTSLQSVNASAHGRASDWGPLPSFQLRL